jgi:heme/copper-type cytochrome/quinol oxidase subunit 1
MFVGFNLTFFPMHLLGIAGMPRRIATYAEGYGFGALNLWATIGAFILGAGIIVSVVNFLVSQRTGALAGPNPWNADTLEWSTESPPQAYAWRRLPVVQSRHPLWDAHPAQPAELGESDTLSRGRLTRASSWRDAVSLGVSTMPRETLAPLLISLTLTALFIAGIFKGGWLAAIATLASFAVAAYWLWPRRREEPEVE